MKKNGYKLLVITTGTYPRRDVKEGTELMLHPAIAAIFFKKGYVIYGDAADFSKPADDKEKVEAARKALGKVKARPGKARRPKK